MRKQEKEEIISVLEGLVSEALSQDEQGGCVYCGGSGKEGTYGYCDESYDCHQFDCAWLAGRKLFDKLKNLW